MVHLGDVEHQRQPFELGERQLAEPLVVEHRQRTHAHTRFVQRRRLRDNERVVLCLAREHEHGRVARDHRVDERLFTRAPWTGVARRQRRDQRGRPFGTAARGRR